MIELDGSIQEGGGQILRTALALSLLTQQPFTMNNIRANRQDPGLKSQHVQCIELAKKLTNSNVEGCAIGSTHVTFNPQPIQFLDIEIDIGTAGSITLLLQSVLLPIIERKKRKVRLQITGGTDVSWSPQFEYFKEVLLSQYAGYADIECFLHKRGYYPAGQGCVEVIIKKRKGMKSDSKTPRLVLDKVGKLIQIRGVSHASRELETNHVAERMERAAAILLQKYKVPITINPTYAKTESVGCGITLYALYSREKEMEDIDNTDPIRVGADVLGEKNISAEKVGEQCAKQLIATIDSQVPVDEHLCDMLIPLLGCYSGTIKTNKITSHTRTNIAITEQFLPVKFNIDENTNIISVPTLASPGEESSPQLTTS